MWAQARQIPMTAQSKAATRRIRSGRIKIWTRLSLKPLFSPLHHTPFWCTPFSSPKPWPNSGQHWGWSMEIVPTRKFIVLSSFWKGKYPNCTFLKPLVSVRTLQIRLTDLVVKRKSGPPFTSPASNPSTFLRPSMRLEISIPVKALLPSMIWDTWKLAWISRYEPRRVTCTSPTVLFSVFSRFDILGMLSLEGLPLPGLDNS